MTKVEELNNFVSNLNLSQTPSVHVNGNEYPNTVLVVDFGNPLEFPKLNGEQINTMNGLMKEATKQLTRRDANVRVSSDVNSYNGMLYWTSIQ